MMFLVNTNSLHWILQKPYSVFRDGLVHSYGILPTLILVALVLVLITQCFLPSWCCNHNDKSQQHPWYCCGRSYQHLLTIVQSESMKPTLQRGDLLISFPLHKPSFTEEAANTHVQPSDKSSGVPLIKGDIILMEVR